MEKLNHKVLDSTEKVDQFIRDLRSCDYYCRRIIEYNLDLEDIGYKIQGVSSPRGKEVIYENVGDPYSCQIKLDLMEQEGLLLRERQRYIDRILDCVRIELIADDVERAMIVDLYVLKMKYDSVSKKYNYSRSSMFDNAKKILSNIL